MDAEAPTWSTEELESKHERAGFSCGHASLDEFLKRYARQNQRSGVSRTFVAVKPGERIVRGYFAIAAGSVRLEQLTEAQRKRLPKYAGPVACLGRVAVDKSVQRQGLGAYMLLNALERVERVQHDLGIHAIEAVAIDEAAKRFYLKYGFMEMLDDPHHVFISLNTVRKLGLV